MTDKALLLKAGAQLLDAAGMLRMEAGEWRSRKSEVPHYWNRPALEWKAKCERIAETDDNAANSFEATAKLIAAVTAKVEA